MNSINNDMSDALYKWIILQIESIMPKHFIGKQLLFATDTWDCWVL